jgi:hypothetical protein
MNATGRAEDTLSFALPSRTDSCLALSVTALIFYIAGLASFWRRRRSFIRARCVSRSLTRAHGNRAPGSGACCIWRRAWSSDRRVGCTCSGRSEGAADPMWCGRVLLVHRRERHKGGEVGWVVAWKLRSDYLGALHHIINRGNFRRDLFVGTGFTGLKSCRFGGTRCVPRESLIDIQSTQTSPPVPTPDSARPERIQPWAAWRIQNDGHLRGSP